MNTRVLGIILIISSLIVAITAARSNNLDTLGSVGLLCWAIGGVCGLVALIRLNGLGSNPVARALGFLPILGFFALIVGDTLRLAGVLSFGDALMNTLAVAGWVAVLTGMLIVGIVVLAVKTWSGWQRFVPLSTIVIAVLGIRFGSVIGNTNIGGALSFLPWIVLGYVVATTKPEAFASQGVPA